MGIKLRPIQNEAIDAVFDSFRSGGTYHQIVASVAYGKTVVASEIIRISHIKYGANCLFLCHLTELVEQTVSKIGQIAPELSCGVLMGKRKDQSDIIVGTRQTVGKNLNLLGKINLLFIDENHLYGPQYQKIVDYLLVKNPRLRVLGMTGTPFTTSQGFIYGENKIWPEPCFSAYIDQMIDLGYLSPYRYKVVEKMEELDCLKLSKGEFKESDLEEFLIDERHMGSIRKAIDEHCEGRRSIMIFCVTIEHAEALAEYLGCKAVHSKLNKKEWRTRVDDFKSGNQRLLVNISQLSVGFDHPPVDALIMARPTMSPALFTQICGRAFRIAEGKEDALIIDMVNNYGRHGFPSNPKVRKPKEKQKEGEKKELESNVCHECFEVVEGGTLICPCCGADLVEKKEFIEINEAVKMKEIDRLANLPKVDDAGEKKNVITKRGFHGSWFWIKLDGGKTLFKFCGNGTTKSEKERERINSLSKGDTVNIISTAYGDWIA